MRGLMTIAFALMVHGCTSSGTAPDGGIADARVIESDLAVPGDTAPVEDRPVLADLPLSDAPPGEAADAPVDSAPDARADVGSAAAGCCCRPGNICAAFCADPSKPCCVAMISIECLSNGGVYQTSCSVGSCQ